jgi:hypothetical protein
LLNEKNEHGAFLIRENQESLVLSVLTKIEHNSSIEDASITNLTTMTRQLLRHYRILEADDYFFIGSHKKFKSLDQLIEFYSSK